ncbi:MAG: vanadium-dependent haloperoxidase [bacterium]
MTDISAGHSRIPPKGRSSMIGIVLAMALTACPAMANTRADLATQALQSWYRLMVELVRHTPTYSPPVASRAFAYLGIGAYQALETGDPDHMTSLVGQIKTLTAPPAREPGAVYDDAVILQAELAMSAHFLFSNTGPSGQGAMAARERKLAALVAEGLPQDVVDRSVTFGQAVAAHILDWSKDDGGAVVDNMGFPREYQLNPAPGHWKPTSTVVQQQFPLLPNWGTNRTFAMPAGSTCDLPPPPAYSTDPTSEFMKQAQEVYDVSKTETEEQHAIARFWADDAMLSMTPPGHWMAILDQINTRDQVPLLQQVDSSLRLGVALGDAFIGCWYVKYEYDYIRPITVIRAAIDPNWQTVVNTPPFPEYASGHSVQSAAAAAVLTQVFGENFAFTDGAPTPDGLPPRKFHDFWQAANEAGMSRLYGGIHFRYAIEQGLEQGKCIAAYANKLVTLK